MSSTSTLQLSEQMQERYGSQRVPWTVRILVAIAVAGYLAAAVWAFSQMAGDPVRAKLLTWTQPQADLVEVTFEVERRGGVAVDCILRAQDIQRVDIGYAEMTVPAGPDYLQQRYPLRVLGPAAVVEVLACVPEGETPRVPTRQFPPGVVPPEQPWTD